MKENSESELLSSWTQVRNVGTHAPAPGCVVHRNENNRANKTSEAVMHEFVSANQQQATNTQGWGVSSNVQAGGGGATAATEHFSSTLSFALEAC